MLEQQINDINVFVLEVKCRHVCSRLPARKRPCCTNLKAWTHNELPLSLSACRHRQRLCGLIFSHVSQHATRLSDRHRHVRGGACAWWGGWGGGGSWCGGGGRWVAGGGGGGRVSLTLAETRVGKNPVSRKPVISKLIGQKWRSWLTSYSTLTFIALSRTRSSSCTVTYAWIW